MSQSHDEHGHDHDHTPKVTGANERKVLLSFFLIFGFMIVEAVGGVLSGVLTVTDRFTRPKSWHTIWDQY